MIGGGRGCTTYGVGMSAPDLCGSACPFRSDGVGQWPQDDGQQAVCLVNSAPQRWVSWATTRPESVRRVAGWIFLSVVRGSFGGGVLATAGREGRHVG